MNKLIKQNRTTSNIGVVIAEVIFKNILKITQLQDMAIAKLKNISPKKTAKMIKDIPNIVFIDVRSEMEFLFIGHPVGAFNIPWIEEPDWEINPNFIRDVRRLILGGVISSEEIQSAAVILICRSGKRSAQAGNALLEAGFNRVYNVDTGFEGNLDKNHQRSSLGGWRYDGLPWEQC